MKMYTQNDEEKYIVEYFQGHNNGHVVDIGANDGITFSNSARLIELGWSANLVEPDPGAFAALSKRYAANTKVKAHPVGTEEWLVKFGFDKWENGSHQAFIKTPLSFFKDGDFCIGKHIMDKPKYVHQLQNLYHALTVEELTIKAK